MGRGLCTLLQNGRVTNSKKPEASLLSELALPVMSRSSILSINRARLFFVRALYLAENFLIATTPSCSLSWENPTVSQKKVKGLRKSNPFVWGTPGLEKGNPKNHHAPTAQVKGIKN